MNDLSTDFDGDEERDRQLADLRVNGKSVGEICQMFNVTVADINRALDRAAQAALTAAARIRMIHVEQPRMDVLEEPFLPAAKGGDDCAAQDVIRAAERRATLLGLNAPLRMDPIKLSAEMGPGENSTQNLERIFGEARARMAGKRLNGGGEPP